MKLGEMKPGSKFKNELGEFIVLDHNDGLTKVVTAGLYKEDVVFGNTCNYIDSSLKKIFDEEITPEFEKVFGDALISKELNLLSLDMQQYGTFECKVRPMTFEEAREFNELIVDKKLKDWWWTCTPWSTAERGWRYSVVVVSPSGDIFISNFSLSIGGVRPFCILKSDLLVS